MLVPVRTEARARDAISIAANENHVVFVGGVQRSGTNMVMEILERSPDTEVFHERDCRAFHEFQLREDVTIHSLAQSRAPCVVFKAICDNDKISTLMAGFQRTSTVWMYRHFDEVVASHLTITMWGRNQIDELVRNRSAAGWRGKGMTDDTWDVIKRYYHPGLNRASAVALFWYYRNQLFFDQRLDQDARVYMVKYGELLADPPIEVSRLARFLGIRVTPRMKSYARQRSIRRRRIYGLDESIRDLCDTMFRRLEIARLQQPLYWRGRLMVAEQGSLPSLRAAIGTNQLAI